jgi:hypothetical protein
MLATPFGVSRYFSSACHSKVRFRPGGFSLFPPGPFLSGRRGLQAAALLEQLRQIFPQRALEVSVDLRVPFRHQLLPQLINASALGS